MKYHVHILRGCAPAPLANYLKALGILRLVGEQADSNARGWWEGEEFRLMTTLSKEEMERFFLEDYEPTPLLSPWNKGCGFFKPDDPGMVPLENSTGQRFESFRVGLKEARMLLNDISHADAVIRAIKDRTKTKPNSFQSESQRQLLSESATYQTLVRQQEDILASPDIQSEKRSEAEVVLASLRSLVAKVDRPPTKGEAGALKESIGYKKLLAASEKRFKSLKATLIPSCVRIWRGRHAEWLSAAVVLDENGEPSWPSLLGTGGNDGNLDFTNNFMQQLGALFDMKSENGCAFEKARYLLKHALWGDCDHHLEVAAIGQYQPGSAGGANSSTGFDGGNLVNSWDFVLMMEGTLLFASRATKRLAPNAFSRASAPFAVRAHAAGFATSGSEKSQRGEQWMPLWNQPATLKDISVMLGEARLQIGKQSADRPIDVARAISRLGVARGIKSFVRYGYLERNGQSTLAVPLGLVQVRQHPQAYLVDDLMGWIERLRRATRENAPARLIQAERRLSDAVFAALTHDDAPDRWQAVLLAAANIEVLQATGTGIEAGPIPPLQPGWIKAAEEDSPEFRLAVALGSAAAEYAKDGRAVDSVRHHFLPLERDGRFKVQERRLANDPRVVATGRDLLRDLSAIVERRLIEAVMTGERRSRLVSAFGCDATVSDLAEFLKGELDDQKLLGLARAFMALRWDRWRNELSPLRKGRSEMPEDGWLVVRLACLPWPITGECDIPAESRLVRLLRSGDVGRAIEVAKARLISSGIRPPMQSGISDPASSMRWAAALAFPVSRATARVCLKRLDSRSNFTKGK